MRSATFLQPALSPENGHYGVEKESAHFSNDATAEDKPTALCTVARQLSESTITPYWYRGRSLRRLAIRSAISDSLMRCPSEANTACFWGNIPDTRISLTRRWCSSVFVDAGRKLTS